MGLLRETDNIEENEMTREQKIILMVLFGLALLLGCGFLGFMTQSSEIQEERIIKAEITADIMVMIPDESPKERAPSPTEFMTTMTEQMITVPSVTYTAEPTPKDTMIKVTSKPSKNNEKSASLKTAFTMTILGKEIPVAYGVEEATLDQSPGWLTSSVKPGESGTCVVYGHRNRNHLQVLKDVAVGDQILIILSDGSTIEFIVKSIEILKTEKTLHIPITTEKQLMITTCYPFYYSGHAPQKMIVIAHTRSPSQSTEKK